ncbi:NADPH:quinone reductase [Orrella sp. JC864]|uniref:NADPH:quinone reductase n=1 Tax=Orrella sp. JC864 TaxID=3120298 RepID=UPI003009D58F
MKAAYYDACGPAEQVLRVGQMPEPDPGPGEVRVRVAVSGINPSDVKTRRTGGARGNPWPRTIPHQDGAGTIDAVGQGVAPERAGQRVWLHECQLDRACGTAAQAVCVPAALAVPLPEGVSFEVGAGLGVPALTAWFCAERAGAAPGACVLVHGAVGAVGFYAAQMARLLGAQVLGTVSNAGQAELAAAAGIQTVPRGAQMPEAARAWLAERGRADFDAAIDLDFAGNLEQNLVLLANGGRLATYASDTDATPALPVRQLMRRNLQAAFLLVYTMPAPLKQRAIAQLTGWLADGALHHPAVHAYPLEEIVQAHLAVETRRHVGKVVVRP